MNLDGSDLSFEQDKQLHFEPGEHRYIINGTEEYRSVTQFVKGCFEEFDTDKWATIKAGRVGKTPEEVADEWKCAGERAASIGTFMHAQIENHFNHRDVESQTTFAYHSDYIDVSQQIDIGYELALFKQFVADTPLKPFRTEWAVFHPGLRLAGTIDLLCRTGQRNVAIYDWKRSEKLVDQNGNTIFKNKFNKYDIRGLQLPDSAYWHYHIQQNIYRYIIEQRYGLTVDAMHLVVLHPTLSRYHVLPIERDDSLMDRITNIINPENTD